MKQRSFLEAHMTWIVALITTVAGMTAWAFQTFETKEDHQRSLLDVSSRLDRIEGKVDRIIDRMISQEEKQR